MKDIPKTGKIPGSGRKKGTPNKNAFNIIAALEANKIDVVKELITDLTFMPPYQRVDIWLKLLEFIYPKRKALDLNITDLPDSMLLPEIERRLSIKKNTVDV